LSIAFDKWQTTERQTEAIGISRNLLTDGDIISAEFLGGGVSKASTRVGITFCRNVCAGYHFWQMYRR